MPVISIAISIPRRYYKRVISTRPYSERIDSIKNIQAAGLGLSYGGIIGMGVAFRSHAAVASAFEFRHPPEIVR